MQAGLLATRRCVQQCCHRRQVPALLAGGVLAALAWGAFQHQRGPLHPFRGVSAAATVQQTGTPAGQPGEFLSGPPDTPVIVVYVTVPDANTGEKIATHLVEDRLAACVNIVPGLTSIYRWEGKVHKDPELLLIIKTRASLVEALTARVKGLHPYEECEVIALPILSGSASYLHWLVQSTDPAGAAAGSAAPADTKAAP